MAEKKKQADPGVITTSQAAKLLMVSEVWIGKLHKMEYVPKAGRGKWNLVAVVQVHAAKPLEVAVTLECEISAPSIFAMFCKCSIITSGSIRRRSNRWQRESTVTGTCRISVVAKMNFTWAGGSSSVFKSALNALVDNMCTSSINRTPGTSSARPSSMYLFTTCRKLLPLKKVYQKKEVPGYLFLPC